MYEQNYTGFLIAAHPKRSDSNLRRSAILIIDHDTSGVIGLQINRPYTNNVTVDSVMRNIGLNIDNDQLLYNGGTESINRIHIIHTLDWFSPTTNKLTEQIGISSDLSVLTAISKQEGPKEFRAIAGFTRWLPGQLEGEILGEAPWNINQSWSFIRAEPELVFGHTDIDQWHRVIADSSKQQVASWF
jgi:putative transcriptional regulator